MELADLMGIAGAAVLVGIVVEALKRALQWTPEAVARWGAIVSLLVGVIVVEVATFATGGAGTQAAAMAGLTGILAGASACGLYDVGGKTLIRAVIGPSGA